MVAGSAVVRNKMLGAVFVLRIMVMVTVLGFDLRAFSKGIAADENTATSSCLSFSRLSLYGDTTESFGSYASASSPL
jgi:hypothetical protein